MPPGLTATRLVAAGLCVGTLGVSYSLTRPGAEAARKVGAEPVPVHKEPTHDAPTLGRAAKLPALAAPQRQPAPAPARVDAPQPVTSPPTETPRPPVQPSDTSAAPPAVAPSPPVVTPAPAPPPPAPVDQPPPRQPPPPVQQPDAVTFDDSG